MWVPSLGLEDPWRRAWQPTPVFMPGASHGQRSLVGYRPWGHNESAMTERLHLLHFVPPSPFLLAFPSTFLLQGYLLYCLSLMRTHVKKYTSYL